MSNENPFSQSPEPAKSSRGDFPAPPPLDSSAMARPPRPAAVNKSFLFWLIAVAAFVISSVISLINKDQAVAELTRDGTISVETAESIAGAGVAVVTLGLAVIWLGLIFVMRGGQNWARIVLTVIGAAVLFFGVLNLRNLSYKFDVGAAGVAQGILDIVYLAAILGAIVFQFAAESNRYFSRRNL